MFSPSNHWHNRIIFSCVVFNGSKHAPIDCVYLSLYVLSSASPRRPSHALSSTASAHHHHPFNAREVFYFMYQHRFFFRFSIVQSASPSKSTECLFSTFSSYISRFKKKKKKKGKNHLSTLSVEAFWDFDSPFENIFPFSRRARMSPCEMRIALPIAFCSALVRR